MKVLITGGAGFLGFHLANFLINKGYKVKLLDIAKFNEEDCIGGVEFVRGDVRNYALICNIAKDVKFIIHAAAALPLWKPYDIYSVNIQGTVNILRAAQKYKIERIVYISSTAVYGIPKKHPIYEEDPLIGVGPYGESKIITEKICESFRKDGVVIPILRPKTFIGPERLGVFEILFDWIKDGRRIPIIGSGKNRYQLLDIDDLLEVIYLTLISPSQKVNDTFNVGAEKFGTVREDIGALLKFANTGSKILPTPAKLVSVILRIFETLKICPLYEWVYGTASKDSFVSIEKIKSVLGWMPKRSNADALINTYKWFMENYDRLQEDTGLTHRRAWDQGVLRIFKKILVI